MYRHLCGRLLVFDVNIGVIFVDHNFIEKSLGGLDSCGGK